MLLPAEALLATEALVLQPPYTVCAACAMLLLLLPRAVERVLCTDLLLLPAWLAAAVTEAVAADGAHVLAVTVPHELAVAADVAHALACLQAGEAPEALAVAPRAAVAVLPLAVPHKLAEVVPHMAIAVPHELAVSMPHAAVAAT